MSKQVFRQEIIWAQVIPQVERHIAKSDAEFEKEWGAKVGAKSTSTNLPKSMSTALASLEKLINLGCERERILRLLYMYVGGEPETIGIVKRTFQSQRDQLLSTARALNKTASKVEEAADSLAFMGIDVHNGAAEDMRSYSGLLTRFANTFFKDLASGRISSRDHHLFALSEMIKEATGARHYKEIAVLVDRVGTAYNPQFKKVKKGEELTYEETSAEAIRGRVQSYGLLASPVAPGGSKSRQQSKRKSKARVKPSTRRPPPKRPQ